MPDKRAACIILLCIYKTHDKANSNIRINHNGTKQAADRSAGVACTVAANLNNLNIHKIESLNPWS